MKQTKTTQEVKAIFKQHNITTAKDLRTLQQATGLKLTAKNNIITLTK